MFFDIILSGYTLVALNSPSVFPLRNGAVEGPVVSAKSALVIDVNRGKPLFEKNSEEMLPVASLTKLLSALVVLDTTPLDKIITLDQQAIDALGDAGDFKVGERVEARHLLFAALIQSSNDAMMGLAEDVGLDNFLSLMRSKAISLDVKKAVIDDPVGLSPKTRMSAGEYAKIAQAGFGNNFIAQVVAIPEYTFKSASGRFHKITSVSPLLFDPRVIASKTGSLREVGENYAVLSKGPDDQRFLTILLGSNDRARDMLILLNWADKAFSWR